MDLRRLQPKEAKNGQSGWYCRGYLPHLDSSSVQFITYCLRDSLPKLKLVDLERELIGLPEGKQFLERRRLIEDLLDRGAGSCVLSDSHVADIVEQDLLSLHGLELELHAWVVMPNHVHLMATFEEGIDWGGSVGRHKGRTSRLINKYLGQTGNLWQRESFDRYIRDARHFDATLAYIHANPVKTGLVKDVVDYRWSSARRLLVFQRSGHYMRRSYLEYLDSIDNNRIAGGLPPKGGAPRGGSFSENAGETAR